MTSLKNCNKGGNKRKVINFFELSFSGCRRVVSDSRCNNQDHEVDEMLQQVNEVRL